MFLKKQEEFFDKIREAAYAWSEQLCWSRPMILLNKDTLAFFGGDCMFKDTIFGLRIAGTFKSDATDFILLPDPLAKEKRVEKEYLHQLKITIDDLNWQVRYLKGLVEILGGDPTIPTHHYWGKRKETRGKLYNETCKEIEKELSELKEREEK